VRFAATPVPKAPLIIGQPVPPRREAAHGGTDADLIVGAGVLGHDQFPSELGITTLDADRGAGFSGLKNIKYLHKQSCFEYKPSEQAQQEGQHRHQQFSLWPRQCPPGEGTPFQPIMRIAASP
jgi:hypothetical protein